MYWNCVLAPCYINEPGRGGGEMNTEVHYVEIYLAGVDERSRGKEWEGGEREDKEAKWFGRIVMLMVTLPILCCD